MRSRLLFVVLILLALAAPAVADDIPRLSGQITDLSSARVLSSGTSRMQPVLDDLVRSDDIQLFVLFVETTGGRTVTDFTDATAAANSLGGNDALLVVALTDRTDALWRSADYLDRLTDRELQTVLSQLVEPRLRDGDYAGAVIAAADGVRSASRGNDAPAPSTPSQPATGGLDLGAILLPLVLVGGGGALLWMALVARRRGRAAVKTRERNDTQRAQEANALLIRADESLRDAQQEMGYAEAQFTQADVAPYRDAVAAASTELKAAFTARQQLDDAVPEDADARRRLVEEIVARATKALSLLDEQRRRVEEMRDLERRAPELLAQLREQIAVASQRVPDAERTLAGFARYAEQSWSSVKSNVVDARDLLGRATAHADEGDTAVQAADAAGAAKAVRAAQQDLTEAVRLIDAIGAVAATIAEAQRTVRDRLRAATVDIEKAGAATGTGASAEHGRRIAAARAAIASAESVLSSTTPDLLAAVKLCADAQMDADAILADIRKEEERRESEARAATAQLQGARDAYRRAADYISPRRRAIGSTARTRLAEAERHLARAQELMDSGDRTAAVAEAQDAQRLADEAWSLAREDLQEAEAKGPWTNIPRGGPVFIPFPFPVGGGARRSGGGWRPPISVPRPGGRSVGGRW